MGTSPTAFGWEIEFQMCKQNGNEYPRLRSIRSETFHSSSVFYADRIDARAFGRPNLSRSFSLAPPNYMEPPL